MVLVGSDPQLSRELNAALAGLPEFQAVVHVADGFLQGVEAVRSRQPELVLVEMGRDLTALKGFAEEAAVQAPNTVFAAVFHQELFGTDVSESALLIEALRAGMRDFLRRPLSRQDLDQLIRRLARPTGESPRPAGKIVSFISNKGGVGKSTLAVNLAAGLARRHPRRVLLVDASLQLGVCANLLDLAVETTLVDVVRQKQRLDATLLRQMALQHECGLDLLAAPRSAVEAGEVDDEAMARILNLARRAYDAVVVDSFPLVDRVMMAVLDLSDRVYLVLESTVPTILGAHRLCELLDGLGLARARQRLVLNRHSSFAGNLRPADVARRLDRTIDHVIPYQKKFLIATNLGRPLIFDVGPRWSSVGRTLHGMVTDLESLLQEQPNRTATASPIGDLP